MSEDMKREELDSGLGKVLQDREQAEPQRPMAEVVWLTGDEGSPMENRWGPEMGPERQPGLNQRELCGTS